MRDPYRITQMLALIEEIWKKEPDSRLCQIIVNVTKNTGDLFYTEDAALEADLRKYQTRNHT